MAISRTLTALLCSRGNHPATGVVIIGVIILLLAPTRLQTRESFTAERRLEGKE